MCMMLIQCFGRVNLGICRAAQTAQIHEPLYAQLALAVECVATALDERGFVRGAAQIAQLVEPCDALLAVLVDHVALSLDERGFVQIAQLVEPCDALLAVLVDHVALSLNERGFVQITQLVEPCDALLAVLVDHVALCLDVRGFVPTTISVTCGEPKCACHAARKKKPNSCPPMNGQVHLSVDTQYVHALGKIFEAGGQPVKNREMRSLAKRGNQAKFFLRSFATLFLFLFWMLQPEILYSQTNRTHLPRSRLHPLTSRVHLLNRPRWLWRLYSKACYDLLSLHSDLQRLWKNGSPRAEANLFGAPVASICVTHERGNRSVTPHASM